MSYDSPISLLSNISIHPNCYVISILDQMNIFRWNFWEIMKKNGKKERSNNRSLWDSDINIPELRIASRLPILVQIDLLDKKHLMNSYICPFTPICFNLYNRRECQTLSYAFLISKNVAKVLFLLANCLLMWFVSLTKWSTVHLPLLKPAYKVLFTIMLKATFNYFF